MEDFQFLISYIDPRDNDLLPINNDDNFHRALTTARPLLRVIIQRKGYFNARNVCFLLLVSFSGDFLEEIVGYGTLKPRNLISSILGQSSIKQKPLAISNPHDFRTVRNILYRINHVL